VADLICFFQREGRQKSFDFFLVPQLLLFSGSQAPVFPVPQLPLFFLVPQLLLGNPLLAKLCFATLPSEENACLRINCLLAQVKERSWSFSSYPVPQRELGNEGWGGWRTRLKWVQLIAPVSP
jgi:hypothetical protein